MSPPPEEKKPTTVANDLLLDSEYDSADDSDFDPSALATTADNNVEDDFTASSDSEDDAAPNTIPTTVPKKKRKRAASISSIPSDDDEQGAEVSIIKTRAQRRLESPSRKTGGVSAGTATTDVDALWAAMNSPAVLTPLPTPQQAESEPSPPAVSSTTGEKMVEIKHTYEFAGKTITESRMVPLSSESARVHLSSASASPAPTPPTGRRPPPKKRASAFDAAAASKSKAATAPAKINTLEKSRLDWAGFVDKEGIGDDLKKWNKGDKGYLDRQAFLGRVDDNRDKQWKEGKKK
ncbi:bucentaur or craniofacial development-domain-containing protein [Tricharina praecox]|uniref:bucentaur or craniofacial development-domain-containing protein n=1 Tax=Tricharina praecox TaxID=43433 RepID=UPI002220C253|nr:bucentaur or craniofacial development-domain-containing protein [Tricharina praecox]KAI5857049.1 bucentaur or craniofacial development-domain-containing protein [Tricharina praecox]